MAIIEMDFDKREYVNEGTEKVTVTYFNDDLKDLNCRTSLLAVTFDAPLMIGDVLISEDLKHTATVERPLIDTEERDAVLLCYTHIDNIHGEWDVNKLAEIFSAGTEWYVQPRSGKPKRSNSFYANPLWLRIQKLHPNAVMPYYSQPGDMGQDLTAVEFEYEEEIDCYIYHTGIAVELPTGYGMLIFPRSSNRKTDAYLTNHVGVVDSGYRGEILLCYKNRVPNDPNPPYQVGDRIGQAVIIPYPNVQFFWSNGDLSKTYRFKGGYGSTGK
jgi:dUTP pyrophosphatase